MNAIGIDYQRTLSVICLREGPCSIAKRRSVGDGQRHMIPNAVADEGLWGSRAFMALPSRRLWGNDQLQDGPWLDEHATLRLWHGFHQRLYTFLGHVEPDEPNGYTVVVGLNAQDYQRTAESMKRFCQAAHFRTTTVIPAVDAMLCRWIVEHPTADRLGEHLLVAVATGDTSCSVRAYRIEYAGYRYPRILSAGTIVSLAATGQAWWIKNLLAYLQMHMHEPIPPEHELVLRDAAIEFGKRLSSYASGQFIRWEGPLQKNFFTEVLLKRHLCAAWPDVVRFTLHLPEAIREALSALTQRDEPDALLLGSIGAIWPFASDTAKLMARTAPIWQSSTPSEDVAWGAACWPEVGEPYAEILQWNGASTATTTNTLNNQSPRGTPQSMVAEDNAIPPDLLPPWKRH